MVNHLWTKEEIRFLKDNVKGISLKELTKRINNQFHLNISESAVANQKAKYSLLSGVNSGCFEKGHVPINKGKKMNHHTYSKCSPTMFKQGNVPVNRVPIGTEKIRADGYTYVKTQDGQLNKNWVLKHKKIYEENHGPIPKGHKVIFADGDTKNFDIDNLILVKDSELLIMNKKGLLTKDKEITKTGVNIARLIDTVNKKKNFKKESKC